MNTLSNPADLVYHLRGIDELQSDTLALRAPVSHGAVLINSTGIAPQPEPVLAVTIDYLTMNIARMDDSPLQIANYITDSRRRLVLAEPIAAMALHQSGENGLYRVQRTPGLKVEDPEGLGNFLSLIASRLPRAARRKQEAAEQVRLDALLASFMDD